MSREEREVGLWFSTLFSCEKSHFPARSRAGACPPSPQGEQLPRATASASLLREPRARGNCSLVITPAFITEVWPLGCYSEGKACLFMEYSSPAKVRRSAGLCRLGILLQPAPTRHQENSALCCLRRGAEDSSCYGVFCWWWVFVVVFNMGTSFQPVEFSSIFTVLDVDPRFHT